MGGGGGDEEATRSWCLFLQVPVHIPTVVRHICHVHKSRSIHKHTSQPKPVQHTIITTISFSS
jgi:hypothetical protein